MEKPRFGGAQEPAPSERIKAGLQLEMCMRVCVCKCACVCVCPSPNLVLFQATHQAWEGPRLPSPHFPLPEHKFLPRGSSGNSLPPRQGPGPRELRPGRHSPGPLSPRTPLHQGHLPAPRLWTSPGHKALKGWHPASPLLSPVS